MYRLVIVAGPNRGSSYALTEGENQIGRTPDNQIVLTSGKVSKRHCTIHVGAGGVEVIDQGSTNGTFLNGALAKRTRMQAGDKVSVGEFVLELVQSGPVQMPVALTSGSSALAMQPEVPAPSLSLVSEPAIEVSAQDPLSKLQAIFEGKIMPFFYGLIMKNEYRTVIAVFFFCLVVVSVAAAVVPVLDLAERSIRREAFVRAKILAREVADRNLPAIAARNESQVDISLLEAEESVRMVAIVNPDLQILAPQSRLNQILAGGPEAAYALAMSRQFREGRERGDGRFLSESIVSYIEPLKVIDPQSVKTVVAGMVIVSIDFSDNLIHAGGMGVAVGTGFVVAGLIAFLFYAVMMRLTFKPLEVLNDELDQALRGALPRVTQEFQVEEVKNLYDNINSAIQRAGKGTHSDFSASETTDWDRELASVRAITESSNEGFVAVDADLVVIGMNQMFEEISGIRIDSLGVSINQVARDQAFPSMLGDLRDRVGASPSRSVNDEFEFSGVSYQIVAIAVGPVMRSGVAVVFKKKE